jgi:hypothetical protein
LCENPSSIRRGLWPQLQSHGRIVFGPAGVVLRSAFAPSQKDRVAQPRARERPLFSEGSVLRALNASYEIFPPALTTASIFSAGTTTSLGRARYGRASARSFVHWHVAHDHARLLLSRARLSDRLAQ